MATKKSTNMFVIFDITVWIIVRIFFSRSHCNNNWPTLPRCRGTIL